MEKENDILFLFFNNPQNNNIFLEWFNRENGIRGECVFKPVGILCRIIRRFHLYSGLPGIGIWFYQWHKEIRPGKKIVCIASKYSPRILKWIKKKEPSVMLINYYWAGAFVPACFCFIRKVCQFKREYYYLRRMYLCQYLREQVLRS